MKILISLLTLSTINANASNSENEFMEQLNEQMVEMNSLFPHPGKSSEILLKAIEISNGNISDLTLYFARLRDYPSDIMPHEWTEHFKYLTSEIINTLTEIVDTVYIDLSGQYTKYTSKYQIANECTKNTELQEFLGELLLVRAKEKGYYYGQCKDSYRYDDD